METMNVLKSGPLMASGIATLRRCSLLLVVRFVDIAVVALAFDDEEDVVH